MDFLFELFHQTVFWLSTILLGLIVIYLVKIWYAYKFFENYGLKTPPFRYFYGNFIELRKNQNVSENIRNWTKKYGKVYGYYEGHLPVLVTSDLDMVQEILVKQYSNFSARKRSPLDRGEHDHRVSVFNATKIRWKKMRSIMNPTFSSGKIRELNGQLLKTSNRLIDIIGKNTDIDLNVSDLFKRFTMDTIWNCAFGLDIDLQNNPNNEYLDKSERAFKNTANFTWPMYLGTYFSEFKSVFINIILVFVFIATKLIRVNAAEIFPFLWLNNKVLEIVDLYKKQGGNKNNYVQLLMDAQSDEIDEYDETVKIDHTQTRIAKKLNIDEIQRNLVIFMLAGYETSSTALSYIFHTLAVRPDEQIKILNEIDEFFPPELENPEDVINTDSVQTLQYLDMFLKEVLRYYALGSNVMNRRCMYPTTVNGYKIPKDLAIVIDVLSIHYDAELWGPEDPNEFHPSRFHQSIKRNPIAYLAFGQGPRTCIGMKFALIEIKLAMVKILRNYEVLYSDKTPKVLEIVEGIVRSPKYPIIVNMKKRQRTK